MSFEVSVPFNTPSSDIIFITTASGEHQMQKVSSGVWTIKLSQDDLNPGESGVAYRYNRNGFGFNTAEFLKEDKPEARRKISFKAGTTQKDTVNRWRWFPPADQPEVQTTKLSPSGLFQARLPGENFLSGQIIEDLYSKVFLPFFDSTASHLKSAGYNYVEIDPPQQWTEVGGLPKVENQIKTSPNYPDDTTLEKEINAYKKAGLTVALGPQLCCTDLNTQNHSQEWWSAYFSETTKFLVHFASLAQKTGVSRLQYFIGHDYDQPDAASRYSTMFKAVRGVYTGKLGEGVWNFAHDAAIIPDTSYITWGDQLDYFYLASDYGLSTKDNPTDAELAAGAGKIIDAAKSLYDKFKKPLFVRTTYFAVTGTWKGNTFYSIADVPWTNAPEANVKEGKYLQNGEDQARVVNAYLQAIAARPWVEGYAQFNYTHWANPLSAELSVRDKPAEDLWKKWNQVILK